MVKSLTLWLCVILHTYFPFYQRTSYIMLWIILRCITVITPGVGLMRFSLFLLCFYSSNVSSFNRDICNIEVKSYCLRCWFSLYDWYSDIQVLCLTLIINGTPFPRLNILYFYLTTVQYWGCYAFLHFLNQHKSQRII